MLAPRPIESSEGRRPDFGTQKTTKATQSWEPHPSHHHQTGSSPIKIAIFTNRFLEKRRPCKTEIRKTTTLPTPPCPPQHRPPPTPRPDQHHQLPPPNKHRTSTVHPTPLGIRRKPRSPPVGGGNNRPTLPHRGGRRTNTQTPPIRHQNSKSQRLHFAVRLRPETSSNEPGGSPKGLDCGQNEAEQRPGDDGGEQKQTAATRRHQEMASTGSRRKTGGEPKRTTCQWREGGK
ncbi:hypothetical protein RHGRI_029100 [Rhododendron griersonianum]|uniref:Uncharacterized protein n=1 Tax=Rhododendron griersonianum TaxID=479676 RepID=A0AAV6IMT8_9ERIC|nr:hypothetical protein RHGRI_029100 [Rhododendron griersonianum]